MNRAEIFQVDPEILGGTPVFTGTRVPVQNLFDYLEAGETVEDFLTGFPSVRRDQVTGVLQTLKDQLLASR